MPRSTSSSGAYILIRMFKESLEQPNDKRIFSVDECNNPPADVFEKNGQVNEQWIHNQELLLNERYPGEHLQLEYHSSNSTMYVVRNKNTNPGEHTTIPLTEWIAKQK